MLIPITGGYHTWDKFFINQYDDVTMDNTQK